MQLYQFIRRRPPLSATHVIVSDCRWLADRRVESADNVVFIRPPLVRTGTLWAPSSTLLEAVRQGAAAVTQQIVDRINAWRSGSPDDRLWVPSEMPG